MYEKVVLRSFI